MKISKRTMLPLLAVFLLQACGESATPGDSTPSGAAYRDTGPYRVGVRTLPLGDREAEIWYPVDPGDEGDRPRDVYFIRDFLPDAIDAILPADANPPFDTGAYREAPASDDGAFPLVIFAHGSSSYRTQSTALTTHLASWGFVVVAPDYLERSLRAALGEPPEKRREDVAVSRAAVAIAKAENGRPGGPLEGRIATDRVGITGHSAGGGSSIRFGEEPDVVTYIPLSAGARRDGTSLPDKPSMWLTGDIDGVVDVARVEDGFAAAASPARLVILEGGGHLAPTDICAIGTEGGGVVQIALNAGLPVPENLQRLGTDGCYEPALPVRDGWPVFHHFVTAQLRWAFGIDPEPVGLSASVAGDFPEARFVYQEK